MKVNFDVYYRICPILDTIRVRDGVLISDSSNPGSAPPHEIGVDDIQIELDYLEFKVDELRALRDRLMEVEDGLAR